MDIAKRDAWERHVAKVINLRGMRPRVVREPLENILRLLPDDFCASELHLTIEHSVSRSLRLAELRLSRISMEKADSPNAGPLTRLRNRV